MTYGTSYLFIGVGVIILAEGQETILLCKGGHFMKNKNIGGMCFVSSSWSAKWPKCKNAQKMQKIIKH